MIKHLWWRLLGYKPHSKGLWKKDLGDGKCKVKTDDRVRLLGREVPSE